MAQKVNPNHPWLKYWKNRKKYEEAYGTKVNSFQQPMMKAPRTVRDELIAEEIERAVLTEHKAPARRAVERESLGEGGYAIKPVRYEE